MDTYGILFYIAVKTDPSFMGSCDQSVLLTMKTNRLDWGDIPNLYGNQQSFAVGYVMGRDGMGRDPRLRDNEDRDYDMGFEYGCRVRQGKRRPYWDQAPTLN